MRHQEYSSSDDTLLGRLVAGKFQIRRCVGIGASGAVYQADQVSLGRTVAVKILRPELASDERLVKRFHDEALAASRLNHPNTVSVIDYGQTDDGLLFLVMEFLRGRTMTEVIEEDAPLPAERVADLMIQVLAGLEEAHANGVIHADLKADNIVVERRRGDWDLAKVVDFGIARLVNAPRDETADKTVCGTPEYMAPELIRGEDPTVATDLYAAGALLYELLVGQTPFAGGGSSLEVLTRHLREQPIAPSERVLEVRIHPALERAALQALAKDPAHRFDSSGAFSAALTAAFESPPSEERVLCDGCGVLCPVSYKFCPECGHQRGTARRAPPELTPRSIAAALGRAETESAEPMAMVRTETADDPGAAPPLHTDTLLDAPRVDDAARGLFPLPVVGREIEAQGLREFMLTPSPTPALQLVGEPGCGRSRLVREACAEAAEHGAIIYLASADPTGLRAPFYPIRAMLAAALQLPAACDLIELETALEAIGLGARDLPGLADMLGHPTELTRLEPPARRRELVAATVRALHAAARAHGRTVMVFEDAERYDAPSQELIRRLGETPGPDDVRLIVTCDRDLADRWPARGDRIDLGPLPPRAIDAIAEHLRRVGNDAMPDADALARNTDCTPSFITHLVRYVTEGGSVAGAPTIVADLIAERLELLPRQASWALQAISALGCEATEAQVAGMLSSLDHETLGEALRLLDARSLIVLDGEIAWVDQELVRNVAYAATPADVRRELHAAALRAYAEAGADAATLGHHAESCGALAQAAELLAAAGDDVVEQLDDRGACRLYNRAMTCARAHMLAGDDETSREQFVSTAIKLAETLRITGEVALARGVLEEARDHVHGAQGLEAQLYRSSAHLFQTEGEPGLALEQLREAIAIAIAIGNIELLTELYLDLSASYMRAGEPERAIAELEEVINLVTLGEGLRATGGPAALWHVLLRTAQLYAAADRPADARAAAEAGLAHAERADARVGIARIEALLARLCENAGDSSSADRYRRAAVDEMRRLGDRRATAELLLTGAAMTQSVQRISTAQLEEARTLADEVGWSEGVDRASEKLES